MSKTIAIIGSGISGTTLAYTLSQQGHQVILFERGQELPGYLRRSYLIQNYAWELPEIDPRLRNIAQDGRMLTPIIKHEIRASVGGMANDWEGLSIRMAPNDFKMGSLYKRGIDWPIRYEELEPYYGQAEQFIGVSGTDEDNPFAPPRSTAFPLPPFELGYYDRIFRDRVKNKGFHFHTTPQARTRLPYKDRQGCKNTGICRGCPFDALYQPSYHLRKALATGNCALITEVTIRRIIMDQNGHAKSVLVQPNDGSKSWEQPADVVIVANGAIESVRLLMLSQSSQFPDGLGNNYGHLGQHFTLHVSREVVGRSETPVFSGQTGFFTGQSMQFADHEQRKSYGALRIEAVNSRKFEPLTDENIVEVLSQEPGWKTGLENADVLTDWNIKALGESDTTENKHVNLSSIEKDAFGDPVAQVNYDLSDFDENTFAFQVDTLSQIVRAANLEIVKDASLETWITDHHHMGGTRMAETETDGVTNKYGQVFGTKNVYVAGASRFSNSMAMNPTLTIVALSLFTSDYLIDTLQDL
jgi:choline dehydrogenase-like flavoprotein